MRSGFGPEPPAAPGPKNRRYTVTPTKATTAGRARPIFRARSRRPSAYSAGVSSAAARVARGTIFVSPRPSAGSPRSAAKPNPSGTRPAAASSRQKGLPGPAK